LYNYIDKPSKISVYKKLTEQISSIRNELSEVEDLLHSLDSNIFKNIKILDFDYVEDEVIIREQYLNEMNNLFDRLIVKNEPVKILISGKKDFGMKATINKFLSDFQELSKTLCKHIEVVKINCNHMKYNNFILLKIVKHFDSSFPDYGFSSDEIINHIIKFLQEHNQHLILVLENIDTLMIRNGMGIFFKLLPMDNLSIICIYSRNTDGFYSLTTHDHESILNEFQHIEFQRFSRSELEKIISRIIQDAFYGDVVPEDVVERVVAIASIDGDLKNAVELLWRAGYNAEYDGRGYITVQDIENRMYSFS